MMMDDDDIGQDMIGQNVLSAGHMIPTCQFSQCDDTGRKRHVDTAISPQPSDDTVMMHTGDAASEQKKKKKDTKGASRITPSAAVKSKDSPAKNLSTATLGMKVSRLVVAVGLTEWSHLILTISHAFYLYNQFMQKRAAKDAEEKEEADKRRAEKAAKWEMTSSGGGGGGGAGGGANDDDDDDDDASSNTKQ